MKARLCSTGALLVLALGCYESAPLMADAEWPRWREDGGTADVRDVLADDVGTERGDDAVAPPDDGDTWECRPSVEVCNGRDDDCDGLTDEDSACPCSTEAYRGHTYLFCELLPWHEAHRFCLDHGCDLAAINDTDENRWVGAAVAERFGFGTWIGFTDAAREGDWIWSNGDPVTFTSWTAGEPNNCGDVEHCGEINGFWDEPTWNDMDCFNPQPFVCESAGPVSVCGDGRCDTDETCVGCPADCGSCLADCESFTWGGHAYAKCPERVRADAQAYCRSAGAELVTIDSAEEDAYLTSITSIAEGIDYSIGLSDAAVEGVWVWDSGAPVTYLGWGSGEPNNAPVGPEGEDCTNLIPLSTGRGWNDVGCQFPAPFICEWDAVPCLDADGDGHAAATCGGDDCDDGDRAAHPGAPELCDDERDNDCDGGTDEVCGSPDCSLAGHACMVARDSTPRHDEPGWHRYCPSLCHGLFSVPGTDYSDTTSLHSFATLPSRPEALIYRIYATVDDLYDESLPYTVDIALNGVSVGNDASLSDVPHGAPYAGPFVNFAVWEFTVPAEFLDRLVPGTNSVTLSGLDCASCGADFEWAVLEWSELEIVYLVP